MYIIIQYVYNTIPVSTHTTPTTNLDQNSIIRPCHPSVARSRHGSLIGGNVVEQVDVAVQRFPFSNSILPAYS